MKPTDSQPTVFIVSLTESVLTRRGNRHPVLAEKLTQAGFQVVYLSTAFYHAETRWFQPEEIEEGRAKAGYRLTLLPALAYPSNTSWRRLAGNMASSAAALPVLLARCRPGDVLIVPSRPPELLAAAALVKKLRKVRVFVDVRDVWPEGLPLNDSLPHRMFSRYCRTLNQATTNVGDRYLYTAPDFLEWVERHGPRKEHDFIPLGYDEQRWTGCQPLAAESPPDTINLVFVGDLSKSMNAEPVIRAVAGTPGTSLTFFGGGEKLQQTRDFVTSLGADNIVFRGYVPKEQLAKELANFHISVVPMNVKFAMPNKLFDAIGAYRPVLAFGENDAARYVVANKIGWKLPFDDAATVEFLRELTWQEVAIRSQNIGRIRSELSKDALYGRIIEAINDPKQN